MWLRRIDLERPWTRRTVDVLIDDRRTAPRTVMVPASTESREPRAGRDDRTQKTSGGIALGIHVSALALLAAGCVELDVTRLPRPKGSDAEGEARSGYLCGLLTPSPVRSYFSPEWKRLTLAVVTPSRKSGTKATVDFSGFDKDGTPGAFPCVPVEEGEPAVVAFEVEGNHGSVEKAARYYRTLGHSSFAPGNADGGLTTIEEKSLGAYSKSGKSRIAGLIKPAP